MFDTGEGAARATLHPRVRAAAEGSLPGWALADEERRAHMERVAGVLEAWAVERGEGPDEVARWRAAAFLHDALRDAEPHELRGKVTREFAEWPDPLLHGPAAAFRLRSEGIHDVELLRAVAYHTVGHPDFGSLATALYCADFLEPGREARSAWRRELRVRFPSEPTEVAAEVVAARIRYLLESGRSILPTTIRFWNRFAEGDGWAPATSAEGWA